MTLWLIRTGPSSHVQNPFTAFKGLSYSRQDSVVSSAGSRVGRADTVIQRVGHGGLTCEYAAVDYPDDNQGVQYMIDSLAGFSRSILLTSLIQYSFVHELHWVSYSGFTIGIPRRMMSQIQVDKLEGSDLAIVTQILQTQLLGILIWLSLPRF